jgi:3-phenylpropionate/trans-cinnamate dioxygenase ferredoxin reductase subunit
MPHHDYLILGGGMTGDAAARGIRELDAEGTIGIVSAEAHPPYDRPPLSKGLWKGTEEERIWRGTTDLGVDVHTGRRIIRLDPDERSAMDEGESTFTFDKLLLATGGKPRKLRDAVPQVIYYRTFEDYKKLQKLAQDGESFTVVGGGFIGSEVAAALAMNGKKVTLLFPEVGICRNVLPEEVSVGLVAYYKEKGVDVRPNTQVAAVRRHRDRMLVSVVERERTETVHADGVVAGIGIEPAVELAESIGLKVEGGIVVDERMRTTREGIWAAGDVAAVPVPALGRRMRFEHEDHANTTGRHAGRSMAGSDEPLDHLSMFYSDLFDKGYEATGLIDANNLQVVVDWKDPMNEGVFYYLDSGQLRGVMVWGVFGKVDEARALIREGGKRKGSAWKGAVPI